jgi:hypothetical protein
MGSENDIANAGNCHADNKEDPHEWASHSYSTSHDVPERCAIHE